MPSETFELKVKPTQNAFLFTSTTLTTLAPSIWYLHFHKYPHFHKKNKDAYIYSTQIPHTKMYIQQFCPLSLFSSKDQVCTYISLCRGDTRKCKNKKFLFLFWVVMKTQPCSVNLLYPRLTGTAFMCKLRPLDDNPIEHTGLQYAKLCSNTESRLFLSSASLVSVLFSLRLSHHYKQTRTVSPYIHTCNVRECFSHLQLKFKSSYDKSSLPLAMDHPAFDLKTCSSLQNGS